MPETIPPEPEPEPEPAPEPEPEPPVDSCQRSSYRWLQGLVTHPEGLPRTLFFISGCCWGLYLLTLIVYGWWTTLAAAIGGIILLALFLLLFVGSPSYDREERCCGISWMVRFCYFFTLLALVLSIAPFATPRDFAAADAPAKWASLRAEVGCAEAATDPTKSWVLPAVACRHEGEARHQWVINVGGFRVPQESQEGSTGTPTPPGATPTGAPIPSPAASTASGDTAPPTQPSALSPAASVPSTAVTSAATATGAGEQDTKDAKQRLTGSVIQGGVVVPLYVVILSLIGGAVSMTRMVPDIQRHAWSVEQAMVVLLPDKEQRAGTESNIDKRNRLACENYLIVRGKLVFEIMQVVSAPMIAIVLVYALRPETGPTTALLAFGAGFASKTVLFYIRAVLDSLQPQYATDRQAKEFHPENRAFAELDLLMAGNQLDSFKQNQASPDREPPTDRAKPKATTGTQTRAKRGSAADGQAKPKPKPKPKPSDS